MNKIDVNVRVLDRSEPPDNSSKPVKKIQHAQLERYDRSIYRSKCPVCKEGFLPVLRSPKTGELLKEDFCILCGQKFLYTDLKKTGLE